MIGQAPAKDELLRIIYIMMKCKGLAYECRVDRNVQSYNKSEVTQQNFPKFLYKKIGISTKSKTYQKHFVSHISRVICAMLL